MSSEASPLVVESVQVRPVETVTRQAAASTVAVVESPVVLPQTQTPLVDATARRVEGTAVPDETELGDAIVAAGMRPVLEGMTPVAPQEVPVKPEAITAVDSVKAAFAPVEVLPTETWRTPWRTRFWCHPGFCAAKARSGCSCVRTCLRDPKSGLQSQDVSWQSISSRRLRTSRC